MGKIGERLRKKSNLFVTAGVISFSLMGVHMMSDAAQGRSFAYNINHALHNLAALFLRFRRDMLRNRKVSIRMPLNRCDLNHLRARKILTLFLETPTLVGLTEPLGERILGIRNTNGFLTFERDEMPTN
jgi:hypothetical protein